MNKIISPIKARCVNLRFYPIDINIITDRLKYICTEEKLKYDDDSINAIATIANGDMRKSINILQSLSMMGKTIDINLCYNSAGFPPPDIIDNLYTVLTNKKTSFLKAYNYIEKNIIEEGYTLGFIIQELVKIIYNNRNKIDEMILCNYIEDLANLEYMVAQSIFNDMYMVGLVAIFKKN